MTKSVKLNGVFALLAAAALVLSLAPAFALADDEGQTNITTVNSATASTAIVMSASTGGNTALGGDSGTAGNGGNVNSSEDENSAGNGGSTGAGGAGGSIMTGSVDLGMVVENILNVNDFEVSRGTNTDDDVEGDDNVTTVNDSDASTAGVMAADTGLNFADGGWSGSAGGAGNVNTSEDENHSGSGGSSGNGGAGGSVETGAVSMFAEVVNLLNSNIVRIWR